MGPPYPCTECRYGHAACGRCGAAVDASPHTGLMDAHGAGAHRCIPPATTRPPEPHECTCGATVYYYRLHQPWLDADGGRHRCAPRKTPIDAKHHVANHGAYGIYGAAGGTYG